MGKVEQEKLVTKGQLLYQNKIAAKEAERLLKVAANTPLPKKKKKHLNAEGPQLLPGSNPLGQGGGPLKVTPIPGVEMTVKERRRQRLKALKVLKLQEKKKK